MLRLYHTMDLDQRRKEEYKKDLLLNNKYK